MKVFVARATGAIGRPLLAQLRSKGHDVVALTRSKERAQALVAQGIKPAIANVFELAERFHWVVRVILKKLLN